MLAKWIICRVSESDRSAFSEAQLQWSALANCEGFAGQFGGFSGEHAHIIGLWSDHERYDHFMRHAHDSIARANRQREFYSHSHVHLTSKVMDLPGEHTSLADAVSPGVFARFADCTVHESNIEHFLAMQRKVWLPAMTSAPGMLGGTLWSFENEPNRFLVSSLWLSESEHDAYSADSVPQLRQLAATEHDMTSIWGHQFGLQRSWSVNPNFSN